MIYLNGDFDGGSTNFVDETQTLHKVKKKWCIHCAQSKGQNFDYQLPNFS